MSIGAPSSEKDMVFAILPSTQPSALAASATVALDSSISFILSAMPSVSKYSLTLSIDIVFSRAKKPQGKSRAASIFLSDFYFLRLFFLFTPSVTLSSGLPKAAILIIIMTSIAASAEQA